MRRVNTAIIVAAITFGGLIGCAEEARESAPEFGTLQGTVTRSVAAVSDDAPAGTLYISLFENDPVQAGSTDNPPVANLVVTDADLSDLGSQISFELPNIPTRPEAYVITAVFDTNQNLEETDPPGPDNGDLVALEGIKSPKIIVNQAVVNAEIELNFECSDGICDPLD